MQVHAQNKHDTTYWQSDPDHIFFKLLHSPRHLRAAFRPNLGQQSTLLPLRRDLIGIGIYGLGLGLEAYFPVPFEHPEEKRRARKARFFDIQGAAFLKQISLAYSYQRYDHWYPEGQTGPTGGYFREVQIAPIYAFNWGKFSWKMPINQSSQQLKSAGSFLISAQFRAIKHSLGEVMEATAPEESETLRGVWVLPGYGYTFSKQGWYLSGAALGGYGIFQHQGDSNTSLRGGYSLFYRVGAGFNDGNWLLGILFQQQNAAFQQEVFRLDLQNRFLKFHAGYRFAAGEGMRKLRKSLPVLKSF